MRMLTRLAALIGTLAVSSCGGGDGACMQPAACGGEISPARYQITSYCMSASGTMSSPFCPAGIMVSASSINLTGTYTFNADKTYSADGMASGTVVETIPASCLTQGQLRLTCDQLSQALQQEDGLSGSCTDTGDCTCTLKLDGMPSNEQGTYATSGTTLTLTPDGGDPIQSQYCASPGSITLSTTAMPGMGSAEMAMIMGGSTMVLTKE